MPEAMVSLATTVLASAVSSVTFSVPSGYRDLQIIAQYKNTDNGIQAMVRLNGDTATNYFNVGMAGYSTSSVASWSNNISRIQVISYTGVSSSEFCLLEMDFLDYQASDKQKTILTRSNHSGEVDAVASRWASTSAITSIVLLPETNTFAAGSTFELFGVIA
jgi:hypothetical protein